MTEARRQVEAQRRTLEEAQAASELCPKWQRAYDAYHAMLESFTENYRELEESVSNSVRVSRTRLKKWRAETHGLLKQLAEMSRMDLPDALAGA